MASLKDQIQEEVRKEREDLQKPRPTQPTGTNESGTRLDVIRPQLDELPHTATGKVKKIELRQQFADYQFPE